VAPEPDSVQPGSFRDPSGFVFRRAGVLYRQVNTSYRDDYDLLMSSGLHAALVRAGLLLSHEELPSSEGHKTIKPREIPFISYPYEWCFSQLKDAALTTLAVAKTALEHGMSLKDASAYNVQFLGGRPVLIDTLSFEKYREGEPWVAYRQFCQHFVAPLALMSRKDVRLSQLLRVYIDGIPLDLAARLLPRGTRWSFGLAAHVHLHAGAQQRYADKAVKPGRRRMTRLSFMGLLDSLEKTVRGLKWRPAGTEWADYYDETNYSDAGLEHKKQVIAAYLGRTKPATVWDLGANTGLFSRVAAAAGALTIAFDIDPAAVERNYHECRQRDEGNMLPLVMDLTNPSPGIGWRNKERMSLSERGPCDTALALALVHHLAIGNNSPLPMVADFLSGICRTLIIEFVPKSDSQVQRLLATREDVFPNYVREAFERDFSRRFAILDSQPLQGSERTVYLMEKNRP